MDRFRQHAADLIRAIPDWPEPGIIFRDISPLLASPSGLDATLAASHQAIEHLGPIDHVVGVEARGFIVGPALALRLDAGFVPIRKAGKLPPPTVAQSYALEYGEATIEMSPHAIEPGARILLTDDVLATGGTLRAARALIDSLGGNVLGHLVLIELAGLNGRSLLDPDPVISLLEY